MNPGYRIDIPENKNSGLLINFNLPLLTLSFANNHRHLYNLWQANFFTHRLPQITADYRTYNFAISGSESTSVSR